MNVLRDDNYEDSKENWINVVLFLADEEQVESTFEIYRGIILHIVPTVKGLKSRLKISDWHFRLSGGDVAFRLRSETEHKDEVIQVVEQIATEPALMKLVKSHTLKEDRGWIGNDQKFKEEYRNQWRMWWWKIECDEILSELAYKVLSYQSPDWACNYAFHDLFNMFMWQSLNGVFAFQSGKSEELANLLTPESAKGFKQAVEDRKSRFVERSVKAEIEKHWKIHGSQKPMPAEARKEWEAKYRKIWDERILKAMFLY